MKYRDQPWELANCRGTDTPSWFSDKGRVTSNHLGILQRICNACEIKDRCLAWALEREERGFWGGQYFPERLDREDGDVAEELLTAGDGDCLPDVWEGSEGEMRAEDR